jgi:hypothetical protein
LGSAAKARQDAVSQTVDRQRDTLHIAVQPRNPFWRRVAHRRSVKANPDDAIAQAKTI